MTHAGPNPLRIKRIAESVINLPTLPTVISKMIELVDNPKTSAGSLARLISTDQALTARILKLANSAYYGFPREVSTVDMAIVVLGFNTVKDMGLSLSVFDMFKESDDSNYFDINLFWEHSIACGIAARSIAKRNYNACAGEAFVAGLLHDIGKAILKQYVHNDFREIMRRATGGERSLDEAEKEVIGTSHGEVGGWLAARWNLPNMITDAIRFHHQPGEARVDSRFVAIVSLANYLCHLSSIGDSGRKALQEPDEDIWKGLEQLPVPITADDIEALQSDFLLEFDRSETFISFIHEETG